MKASNAVRGRGSLLRARVLPCQVDEAETMVGVEATVGTEAGEVLEGGGGGGGGEGGGGGGAPPMEAEAGKEMEVGDDEVA